MQESEARRVLIVEDDPELNELIGAYVQIAGFGYARALDAASALRAALELRPALIVLDVMLPDQDGFEVLKQLKADPRTANIPVVILTALDREEYRARGKAQGVREYMTKPFDPDRLVSAINRYISPEAEPVH